MGVYLENRNVGMYSLLRSLIELMLGETLGERNAPGMVSRSLLGTVGSGNRKSEGLHGAWRSAT